MKSKAIALILLVNALGCFEGWAQQGILPGEPDPNTSPKHDQMDNTLLDDRLKCSSGKRKFQKMVCGRPKSRPECKNYKPVSECRRRAQRVTCTSPQVPVPVYRCRK